MTGSGAKPLCVPTAYASVDQLVRALHPFAEGTTLFVATPLAREVGMESPFAILLADRSAAIQGWCIVVDAWDDAADSPYGARGLKLGLYRLTAASEAVLARCHDARTAPPAAPATTARRPITIRIPAMIPSVGRRTGPVPRIDRAPGERTTPLEVPVVAIPPRTITGPIAPPPNLADGSQPLAIPPRSPEPAVTQPLPVDATQPLPVDAGWDSGS